MRAGGLSVDGITDRPTSQPTSPLEHKIENKAGDQHRQNSHRVAEFPTQLGHVVKVHAIDGAYRGRGEQDCGPGGDAFNLLVFD